MVLEKEIYFKAKESERRVKESKNYAEVLTLKGCNSTGSIAMKIVIIKLIERRYDLKVSKFC
jgi:hypothetical protein